MRDLPCGASGIPITMSTRMWNVENPPLWDMPLPIPRWDRLPIGGSSSTTRTATRYQVCGIHGGAYIDVDAQCGEKLTNIREGDELIFRYAQGEPAYGRAVMETRGKGSLEIFLDAQKVGTLEISGDGETLCSETILSMEGLPPKKDGYEVTLRCTQGEGLELLSVTLDR